MSTKPLINDVYVEARASFDNIYLIEKETREQCRQDRRFYSIAGAQWEGALTSQYQNRPRIEVNKIHLSVMRIISEYRNNRITVDFTDRTDSPQENIGSLCDNLYRTTEQDSNADEAYDSAFEEAVGGGIGAWRLRNEYVDEYDRTNAHQHIVIEPIYDADKSVYFDLNAQRQDKADARYAYVIRAYSRTDFQQSWGDTPKNWPSRKSLAAVASWPIDDSTAGYDWAPAGLDVVYIAEYYRVEETRIKLSLYETLDGQEETYDTDDFKADDKLLSRLEAIGSVLIKTRYIKRRKVHKYIMSGGGILEDCGYIAGNQIPIVPVYGKRWYVDNKERAMGHVRLCKDAQRLKNMQLSSLAELAVYSPVEKPIFFPEQIAAHSSLWSEDNLKNTPYLLMSQLKNPDGSSTPAPPPAYTRPPAIPPAMGALLELTDSDIRELLGNQEKGEQVAGNLSGHAIELVQSRLDMQTYIYVSNFAKAMQRSGQIWLSMAQDLFVENNRRMKGVDRHGGTSTVTLNQRALGENCELMMTNHLPSAKLDVGVTVGASSASRRASTVRSLIQMLQFATDPDTQQILTSSIMMNMDGEGLDDIRDYFRQKLVRLGAVKPSDEELEQLQAEADQAANQPDPQAQLLQSAAANEMAKAQKAQADTVKSQADTVLSHAKAAETRAQTIERLANIERKDQEAAIKTAETMANIIDKATITPAPVVIGINE